MSTPSRPRRQRTTRPSVKLFDRIARTVIRVGGIATIASISTVFLFLLWVVWPLLRPEALSPPRAIATQTEGNRVLATGIDDTQSTIWALTEDGRFLAFDAATGERISELRPFESVPTAFGFPVNSGRGVFGFADGSMRFVRIESRTEYRDVESLPAALRDRQSGERFVLDGRVGERIGLDQFALRSVGFSVSDPVTVAPGSALVAVDLSVTSVGLASASVDANGVLRVTRVTSTQNFLTGKEKISTESAELALAAIAGRGLPRWVMLRGLGDNAMVVWQDGHAVRVDAGDLEALRLVEEVNLLGEGSGSVSSLGFVNGKNTLLVGSTKGALGAWFRVPAPKMATGDGARLLHAFDLPVGDSRVTALASSPRTRLIAVGYGDGSVRVMHVTSNRVVAETAGEVGAPVSTLALVPDDSAVLAWDGRFTSFALDAPHPEVSARALLRPVHYEGYAEAEHVWQSSSGTDDFEPKFGLWPLVFGTLKATFYAMLFGVPIALLAAIHSSEFLHPNVKSRVKPAIEMLASLPSVVLGFLAALVLAPLVEQAIPEVLASAFLVPFCLILAAHVWQFVPVGRRSQLQSTRVVLAATAIVLGGACAFLLGPMLEKALFAGDLRLWLDGNDGDARGGWFFILLAPVAVLVSLAISRSLPQVLVGYGSAPVRPPWPWVRRPGRPRCGSWCPPR